MASKAVQQLLEQGQRSGLFSAAAAQDLLAHLTVDEPLTADEVVSKMLEKKVLTAYQAEQLLAGRPEECLVAGRYRILEKLGEGGMGAVFKAHDTQLDRDVAVKVLPAQSLHDADAIARFQREARALAKLSHPNIIQAYDSGADKGRHFLVMEYVEGANLAALLRQQGAIAPALAADLICQAALGLQHAHEKGLIHRDIKPGNLLAAGLARPASFTPAAESERYRAMTVEYPATPVQGAWKSRRALVKILDLGLARFLQDQLGDGHLTQEGAGLGTPDYMAPEQFRDALHADVRTDIYGLGCTLYHLIAGTVPFPGSSFSEKAQAHAKKEPIPLGERGPEVPGGLEYVVSKMMAKHPDDRYQTAGEVAEALSPHVASGSQSMMRLRQTGKWPPGALTLTMSLRKRRKRMLVGGGVLAAAVVCLSMLVFLWPGLFGLGPAPEPPGPSPAPRPPDQPDKVISKKPEPAKPKVETIKNGLTVAKDGTGEYKTIGEALEKIKPGQTIRVLDDAVYKESLSVRNALLYSGITLEAPRRAAITAPGKRECILIHNVPGVVLRGFRFKGDGSSYLVTVAGRSHDAVLEQLDFSCDGGPYACLSLETLNSDVENRPVVVQSCQFRGITTGIRLSGLGQYRSPLPSGFVAIRDNTLTGFERPIWALGLIHDIHIVGNRIWAGTLGGLQLENLMPGTKNILVANNTCFFCTSAFRLWDDGVKGEKIELRNNLTIASTQADMVFIDSGGDPAAVRGPGDGALVLKNWHVSHNWRETKKPTGNSYLDKSWIPPSTDQDVCKDDIAVLSRKPEDTDFLRPAKNSELAKAGAGGDLPTYVGAVPPEGVEPWNWQWTWDARINKRLTVSKDPKAGGRYRTIAGALKAAGPKMTIRVLDAEKYPEPLVINDSKTHEGLVLEAPRGATLVLADDSQQALLIHGVANVRVRGFRLEDEGSKVRYPRFILVTRGCPGLILEQLHLRAVREEVGGIIVLNATLPPDAEPMIIRKCNIDSYDGVFLSGLANTPLSRIRVLDNRIKGKKRGIVVDQATKEVLVAGNVVSSCQQAGIQIENPLPAMQRVLVANNTVFNNGSAVRIWCEGDEGKLDKSRVEFRNNILMQSTHADFVYFHQVPGASKGDVRVSVVSVGKFSYAALPQ
jgi:serine/threonine protein kinase